MSVTQPDLTPPTPRLKLIASAAFFFGFLGVQVTLPALAWFGLTSRAFAWHMFSGAFDRPTFTVVFDDGSLRTLARPTARDAPLRAYSASVPADRLIPRRVCTQWTGVREVRVDYRRPARQEVIVCPVQAR